MRKEKAYLMYVYYFSFSVGLSLSLLFLFSLFALAYLAEVQVALQLSWESDASLVSFSAKISQFLRPNSRSQLGFPLHSCAFVGLCVCKTSPNTILLLMK